MTDPKKDEFRILVEQAFNEGIRTAAGMVRHCATSARFNLALRIVPQIALKRLAEAIDHTTVNPPLSDQ